MQEISYKDLKFNPFNLIGGEWMLVTAGNEQTGCNTMTASWGQVSSSNEGVYRRERYSFLGNQQGGRNDRNMK